MCENHATSKGNGEDLAYFRIVHNPTEIRGERPKFGSSYKCRNSLMHQRLFQTPGLRGYNRMAEIKALAFVAPMALKEVEL
jgi:hypothetical protein